MYYYDLITVSCLILIITEMLPGKISSQKEPYLYICISNGVSTELQIGLIFNLKCYTVQLIIKLFVCLVFFFFNYRTAI